MIGQGMVSKNQETIKKLKNARKLGIALGGGGARGIAHLGVLKVLSEMDIHPQVVSGTSFGSIIGAFYCGGYSWKEIVRIEKKVKWIKMVDVSFSGGLMKGDALGRVLSEYLPATFEELDKPLSVVATNLESGKRVIISSGDLIKGLRASACFPGIFQPVELNGMTLIDGGMVDNVPISALKPFGVDATIAVSVNAPLNYSVSEEDESHWWSRLRIKAGLKRATLPFDILMKALDIMLEEITVTNIAATQPDLYIHADLSGIRIHNFDKFEKIFKIGEKAARQALNNFD
jgi:NTE family protein